MRKKVCRFTQNIKAEIVAVVIFIALYVGKHYTLLDFPVEISLEEYLSSDRLSGIASFFSITIGVYIAIIAILATSEIGISREILKRRLDAQLISVIMAGMVENFFTVGFAIFVPFNKLTRYALCVFIAISVISFAKFVYLLILIFKANMDKMAKTIDDDDEYKAVMRTHVEIISKFCQRHMDK